MPVLPAKPAALAAAAVALVILGAGAIAGVAASSDGGAAADGPRYHVVIPDDASDAQRQAVAAKLDDSPIPVQDQDGVRRGFVRDSALTGRDARVNEKILGGFREYAGGDDREYDELYEALRVLDPVPVVDEGGAVVGYFTGRFQTVEQIAAATPAAQALVAERIR